MVRRYEDRDFAEVDSWFGAQRNGAHLDKGALPEIGFIVSEVACGFLYKTDSNMCILETFVANPRAHKEVRDEAVHTVIRRLIALSKELGFKYVYGFSTSQSMIKRGLEHGFKVQETSTTIVLEHKENK